MSRKERRLRLAVVPCFPFFPHTHSLFFVSSHYPPIMVVIMMMMMTTMSCLSVYSFSSTMIGLKARYMADIKFLGRHVWPRVKAVAYCHDSYSCRRRVSSHPFPIHRRSTEHLGQVFDQFSVPRAIDVEAIRRHRVNTDCVPTSSTANVPFGSANTTTTQHGRLHGVDLGRGMSTPLQQH